MGWFCCVPLCKNTYKQNCGISFHSFPKDVKLRNRWIFNIRRDVGKHFEITKFTKVCSQHFQESDFRPFLRPKLKMLKANAEPTVFSWTRVENNTHTKKEEPSKMALWPQDEQEQVEEIEVKVEIPSPLNEQEQEEEFEVHLPSEIDVLKESIIAIETPSTVSHVASGDTVHIKAEEEILGPHLTSLLDPTADECEGLPLPRTNIKVEEPFDDIPSPSSSVGERRENIYPEDNQFILDEDIQFILDKGLVSEEDASFEEFTDNEYAPDSSDLSVGGDDSGSEQEEGDSASVLATSDWKKGPIIFNAFPFEEVTGLTVDMSQMETPYSYFRLIFSDEIIDLILTETNRYAEQKVLSGRFKTFANWRPVERSELLIFMALFFHMSIVSLPTLRDYWRKDSLYKMSFFSKLIKRDRFLQILSCLHFVNSSTADKSNKLWKCQSIVDFFNYKMQLINVPEKELAIDESMMLFKGKTSFRRYMKYKPLNYGMKFYMLCQSNGLIQKISLCTGKETTTGKADHVATVVNGLIESLVNKGYCLYMNHFYTSYALSKDLLEKKTHTTGTLLKTRKGNSQDVAKEKLKKGESVFRCNEGILQLKWRDTRGELMQSTLHGPEMREVRNRKGEMKKKPEVVLKYHSFMSGIDRVDQLMSYYDILGKTINWYRKVCLRIFHMMLINASILYRTSHENQRKNYPLQKFHEDIVKDLITEGERQIPTGSEDQTQAQNEHFPVLLPIRPSGAKGRKKCRLCATNKKRIETYYCCEGCDDHPPLCVLCFKFYKHK